MGSFTWLSNWRDLGVTLHSSLCHLLILARSPIDSMSQIVHLLCPSTTIIIQPLNRDYCDLHDYLDFWNIYFKISLLYKKILPFLYITFRIKPKPFIWLTKSFLIYFLPLRHHHLLPYTLPWYLCFRVLIHSNLLSVPKLSYLWAFAHDTLSAILFHLFFN